MAPLWLLGAAALAFPTHDTPLRAGASAPDDAAVVIGIEDYFALPDVPYAERDAQAFRDLLLYTVGVPSERVRLLTSDASKELIDEALAAAVEQVGEEGTLWIYFAGHGAASPSTGERLLLGIDTLANATSFDGRSVSLPAIQAKAEGTPRTVLVVDACYAGAGRDGAELLPGKRFAVPSYAVVAEPRWIAWHAAQPNELSGPLEAARHGAFTWAAIGAMRGWADGQLDGVRDGRVTLHEAELYVEELLRAVDITDQRPALQAGDRERALVALPMDKLEDRPDPTTLERGASRSPVGPPAKTAAIQEWNGRCVPVTALPETRTLQAEWPQEPGVDPRATWVCVASAPRGGTAKVVVNRFPPVDGASVEQLLIDNLSTPKTRVPGPALTVYREGGGRKLGNTSAAKVGNPASWATWSIETPRGELEARLAPVRRGRGNPVQWAMGPVVVVEDDRQPGAVWMCQSPDLLGSYEHTAQVCGKTLGAALAADVVEPGVVR